MEVIKVEKSTSRGIAIAPAYLYRMPELSPEAAPADEEAERKQFAPAGEAAVRERFTSIAETEEMNRFAVAKEAVLKDLRALAEQNEIFAAHAEIAADILLQEGVEDRIKNEGMTAQQAVSATVEEHAAILEGLDDAYLKERGADVRDIGKRYLAKLKGVALPDLGSLPEPVIVVAKELYPSELVNIDTARIKGILTEAGGVTSHAFVIAKSLGIPMLVGAAGILLKVSEGDMICMDAGTGQIVVRPDAACVQAYKQKKAADEAAEEDGKTLRNTPAVTKDGKRILLCANVGNVRDIEAALPMNIDGIGLFRTELLYMENTHFPTEEEQFAVYKKAAELMPQELTIRTLDIGGDKELSYYKWDKEENPCLGWRGIRILLDKKELFKEQLRAILRAGAYGHVRMMFPMIISLEELREAKALVAECKEELRAAGIPFDEAMQIGMMIETPAAVLLAEEFAKEADFFSIGTNDLTQYLLAVDRGNTNVSEKFDYFHPAVTKAIGQVIAAGHAAGIQVGMCGEMAGDPKAVTLLLELGLDAFSMSAGCIDEVRAQILQRSE